MLINIDFELSTYLKLTEQGSKTTTTYQIVSLNLTRRFSFLSTLQRN